MKERRMTYGEGLAPFSKKAYLLIKSPNIEASHKMKLGYHLNAWPKKRGQTTRPSIIFHQTS
jgi:hypothetical protein